MKIFKIKVKVKIANKIIIMYFNLLKLQVINKINLKLIYNNYNLLIKIFKWLKICRINLPYLFNYNRAILTKIMIILFRFNNKKNT